MSFFSIISFFVIPIKLFFLIWAFNYMDFHPIETMIIQLNK